MLLNIKPNSLKTFDFNKKQVFVIEDTSGLSHIITYDKSTSELKRSLTHDEDGNEVEIK